jgi:hypothetical protein
VTGSWSMAVVSSPNVAAMTTLLHSGA